MNNSRQYRNKNTTSLCIFGVIMVIHSNSNIGTIGNSAGNSAGKTKQSPETQTAANIQDNTSPNTNDTDSVSLSPTAQNIAKIEANLAQTPDVNAAKVSEIKTELESGAYKIDDNVIAEKILSEDSYL